MPNTPTIKGDNTVLWGSGGLYTGNVVGGSLRKVADIVLVPDNVGFDAAKVYYNHRREADIEVVVQTAAPALEQGDQVTIAGQTGFLVDDTEEIWAQKDVRKFRLKATKHMGMTLTP